MTKFLLLGLLILSFAGHAAAKPCFGNGDIDHCQGARFICKDGSVSRSTKNCPEYTGQNKQTTPPSEIPKPNSEQITIESIMKFIESHSSIFSIFFGFFGGGLSGTALTYFLYHRTALKHARLASLSSVVTVELSAATAHAFRFHGITDADLKAANITEDQLAYLVANFTAGRIHDSMTNEPFGEKNYRYKMLAQPETQRAWSLILKMMTEDEYIVRLQSTKDEIEKKQKNRCIDFRISLNELLLTPIALTSIALFGLGIYASINIYFPNVDMMSFLKSAFSWVLYSIPLALFSLSFIFLIKIYSTYKSQNYY